MKKSMGPASGLPEKEVFMTEIMKKESNLNTMEGRKFAQCHAVIANRMEGMDRLTAVDCGSWPLDIMLVAEPE